MLVGVEAPESCCDFVRRRIDDWNDMASTNAVVVFRDGERPSCVHSGASAFSVDRLAGSLTRRLLDA